jgi:hypothetical protein
MHHTRSNPVAKAVRTREFRQRIVPDIKKYRRVHDYLWRKEA